MAAKVGFFLEQRQGASLTVKACMTRDCGVEGQDRRGGQLVKKWNLILPLHVEKILGKTQIMMSKDKLLKEARDN